MPTPEETGDTLSVQSRCDATGNARRLIAQVWVVAVFGVIILALVALLVFGGWPIR